MKRRPLTDQEARWAAALKRVWLEKKRELGLTQERAADLMGWSSHGAVAQYLNGNIPLNTEAMLKFARLLKVSPSSVWPDERLLAGYTNEARRNPELDDKVISGGVDNFFQGLNTLHLTQKYQNTSDQVRDMVDELLTMPTGEAEKFVKLYRTAKDNIYNGNSG